jgi:hypothetical protein
MLPATHPAVQEELDRRTNMQEASTATQDKAGKAWVQLHMDEAEKRIFVKTKPYV